MGVKGKRTSYIMLPELQNLLLSAIAIILSLFITAVIMLASGYHPFEAFRALLDGAFGSRNSMATTLGKTIPLVFVGLACAYSNRGDCLILAVKDSCILEDLRQQSQHCKCRECPGLWY